MNSQNRLESIQALRGIAALMVVICHTGTMFDAYHVRHHLDFPRFFSPLWSTLGACGVDLFFVISGFILTHVAWNRFQTEGYAPDFFIRRLIRIAPLYWICTSLMVLCFLLAPSLVQSARSTSFLQILTSYLFIPFSNGDDHHPVLAMGWSLNYEMFFYTIFSFLLPFKRGIAIAWLALTLISLTLIGSWTDQWFLSNTVILEFLYGVALSIAFRKFRFSNPGLGVLFVIGGFAILTFLLTSTGFPADSMRGFVVGIPSFLIVLGALFGKDKRMPKWLVELGNASYSLYLTHFFAGVAIARIWVKFLNGVSPEALTATMIVIPCGIAILCYRFLELPVTQFLTKIPKKAAVQPDLWQTLPHEHSSSQAGRLKAD